MFKIFRISIYIVKGAVLACVYFLASYNLVYDGLANRDLLYASILNIAFIFAIITMDKLEGYIWNKVRKKKKSKPKSTSTFAKIKNEIFTDVPIKTGLYFFYIVLLVCSAIVTAEPDFPVLYYYSDYLKSVYYGLLVLVASDKFLALVLKQMSKGEREERGEEQ